MLIRITFWKSNTVVIDGLGDVSLDLFHHHQHHRYHINSSFFFVVNIMNFFFIRKISNWLNCLFDRLWIVLEHSEIAVDIDLRVIRCDLLKILGNLIFFSVLFGNNSRMNYQIDYSMLGGEREMNIRHLLNEQWIISYAWWLTKWLQDNAQVLPSCSYFAEYFVPFLGFVHQIAGLKVW